MEWQPPPDLVLLFEAHWPLMQDLHRQGSLAPCGASMDLEGAIRGDAFVIDGTRGVPTAEWVVRHFAAHYRELLERQRLRAAGVFFHGERIQQYVDFASSPEAANALVAILEQADGQSALAVVEYVRADEGWQYSLPASFHPAQGLPADGAREGDKIR